MTSTIRKAMLGADTFNIYVFNSLNIPKTLHAESTFIISAGFCGVTYILAQQLPLVGAHYYQKGQAYEKRSNWNSAQDQYERALNFLPNKRKTCQAAADTSHGCKICQKIFCQIFFCDLLTFFANEKIFPTEYLSLACNVGSLAVARIINITLIKYYKIRRSICSTSKTLFSLNLWCAKRIMLLRLMLDFHPLWHLYSFISNFYFNPFFPTKA